jgi:hypothetical protein
VGGFRLDHALDRHWLGWMLTFWGCVIAWYLVQRQGNIHWLVLTDTDDNLRLAQVRALLAGQGWYDLRQYRLDPALGGFDIHWSRLVDLPIAGLILLLRPFLGVEAAERWACGLAPLLPLAVTMTALSLTVRRLISPYAWPMAMLVLMSCTSTMAMYASMRIDHHGWQLACLAMAVAGLADPNRARGGATVGISSAVSLTIGLEMLPYCAMADGIIVLRWIWDRADARRMAVHGLTLAGGSAIGFALFASNANQVMRCDALTPVWLSITVATGSLLFALSLARADSRWVRFGLAALVGTAIVAGFALFFPQCLGRPEQVSDELARTWLNNVREARPIYKHPLKNVFPMAALPVVGIIGALLATWRARRSAAASAWGAITLFTTFAGAMLLWQVRAGPAAQMLSVPGATALAWIAIPWFLKRSNLAVRIIGALVVFLIATGLFAGLTQKLLPANKPVKGVSNKVGKANAACGRLSSLLPLNAYPKATVFAHVDMGPRLITTTHHDAIAGPYHRNGAAILDVHHAFTGPTSAFRGIAARHKAQYLLICPDMSETTIYRSRGPRGFFSQLYRGQVPNWLEPMALPANSPFKLWRIRYDLPDAPVSARSLPVQRPAKP